MFKYEDPTEKNEAPVYRKKDRHGDSRLLLGFIFVGIGAILIARNFGWLDYEFSRYLISSGLKCSRNAAICR